MSVYLRVRLEEKGKAFIVDDTGSRVPPGQHRAIVSQITETVNQHLYVYVGYSPTLRLHKIGVSHDPIRRTRELGVILYCQFKADGWGEYSGFALEKLLHQIYSELGEHVMGEWFELDAIDIYSLIYLSDYALSHGLAAVFAAVDAVLDAMALDERKYLDCYSLMRNMPRFDWRKAGFCDLYRFKAIVHFYERRAECQMLGLLLYESVLNIVLKPLVKANMPQLLQFTDGCFRHEYPSVLSILDLLK